MKLKIAVGLILAAFFFCLSARAASTDFSFDAHGHSCVLTVSSGNLVINEDDGTVTTATPAAASMTSCLITAANQITVNSALALSSTGKLRLEAANGVILNSNITANGAIELVTENADVQGTGTVNSTGRVYLYAGSKDVTISVASSNLVINQGSGSVTVTTVTTPSDVNIVANSVTTSTNITMGASAALYLAAAHDVTISNTVTADGGIILGTVVGSLGGAGSVNSAGPICIHYFGGGAITFGTTSSHVVVTDGVLNLTIGTTPASITALLIDNATTLATTSNVNIGAGQICLQAVTSITYNNNISATGGIILNCAGTKSGSGTLTGTVTQYP